MPLTWDHAYGGRDAHAERLMFDQPKGALDAFLIGGTQIVPRFTHVFGKAETIDLLAFAYDAQVDAGGKAEIVSQFTVMKTAIGGGS